MTARRTIRARACLRRANNLLFSAKSKQLEGIGSTINGSSPSGRPRSWSPAGIAEKSLFFPAVARFIRASPRTRQRLGRGRQRRSGGQGHRPCDSRRRQATARSRGRRAFKEVGPMAEYTPDTAPGPIAASTASSGWAYAASRRLRHPFRATAIATFLPWRPQSDR